MPRLPKTTALAGLSLATLTALQLPSGQQGRALSPAQVAEILSHFSIVYLDDGQGGTAKTIRIEGVNLQVVNGQGTTESANGLGNLIVGYNEFSGQQNDRTGSHNIVGGRKSNYTSYGGVVAGIMNTISAPYASAPGGSASTAGGYASSVTGGHGNSAMGGNAWVSGGNNNVATGLFSVISGGRQNDATGELSVVAAGLGNEATGYASSVLGGALNLAEGQESAVLGGRNNLTSKRWASVAGGRFNTASAVGETVVGPVTFVD